MKFYLISDNIDTAAGMRLAGIEGVVVHETEEVNRALQTAMDDPEIGIVLMTERLVSLCPAAAKRSSAKQRPSSRRKSKRRKVKPCVRLTPSFSTKSRKPA